MPIQGDAVLDWSVPGHKCPLYTAVKIQFLRAKHPLIDLSPRDELNLPPFESPTKLNDLLLRNDHERDRK